MVRRRDDMVGLDSGIIMNPKVWQASGHVDGFTDPMVDCKESKMRYRADQLFAAEVRVEGTSLGWISLVESEKMEEEAKEKADLLKRKAAMQGSLDSLNLRPYDELDSGEQSHVPSPATGKAGSLTPPGIQHDVRDSRRSLARRVLSLLSSAGNRPGNLCEFQKRCGYRSGQSPLWHCPNRESLSKRDYPEKFHFPIS